MNALRYELPRIAVVVLVVDVIVAAVCVGICAAFFEVRPVPVGSVLFVAALVLALGAGSGSVTPMTGGFGTSPSHYNPMSVAMEGELLATQTQRNIGHEIARLRSLSWALVFGIAAIPLVVASIVLLFWMAE